MRKGKKNHSETTTTQRDWHDLKPGDVIFFATGWYEVFDAYPVAQDAVVVKLISRAAKAPAQIQTYRVRVNAGSKATCRA